MAGQINVNFHQTFKPEAQYISSILNVADGKSALSIKDISALTGIPQGKSSGKVEPHISYAEYMGLITSEKNSGLVTLFKTRLGELVNSEDPGVQEDLTKLLCHAMLLRNSNGADVWASVFRKILPQYKNGIKKELLVIELNQLFDGKVNTKNMAPFYGSYDDMFSGLNVLEVNGDLVKTKSMPYDKEFIYLYTYILWEYWDEQFQNHEEISSNELEELKYGEVFGWDEQMEYVVLEHMSDKGLLRMNRQLMPYTLRRLVDKDTILQRLYSELC